MLSELTTNLYLLSSLSAILAFALAVRIYPVIIYTVRTKNLMDEPEDRSSHSFKTPTLGGVGLFVAFFISAVLFAILADLQRAELIKLLTLGLATMILLFLGIKDDLIALAPKKKFLGQLTVSAMVIFITDIRIESLEGLLGVGTLPYVVSVLFTLFVFILVINAFNLIDGIDGLAGTIALISCATFGVFSVLNEQFFSAIVSFSAFGAVVGFLLFNLSKSRKLFMGDSGSMVLGFLLAYQGVYFLQLNQLTDVFAISNAPIVLLAVLSFPLLDTLRVFIIRAREGRSPFSPDRNHIHHILIDGGLNHKQATIFLAIANVLVIELAILVKDLEINLQLVITVLLGSFLYTALYRVNSVNKWTKAPDVVSTKINQGKVISLKPQDSLVREGATKSLSKLNRKKKNTAAVLNADKVKTWLIGDKRIKELVKSKERNLREVKILKGRKSVETDY